MSLSCSQQSRPPKWKMLEGLKLRQRDKIRLNNAIWRARCLQRERNL